MPEDPKTGLFYTPERAAAAALAVGGTFGEELARQVPSRRDILRWAGWGAILLMLGQWTNGFLGFFRPGRTGAFGTIVSAGNLSDLKIGDVTRVLEGKFYLTRVPEGLLALWQKCPHLGCTVPWQENDPVEAGDESFARKGRFNCPCHSSIYNRYGQILKGAAPRSMDRFPIILNGDRILVDTRTVISRQEASPDEAVLEPAPTGSEDA